MVLLIFNFIDLQFTHKITTKEYHYIIGGAGLAGLTLAYKMMKNGLLEQKQLVIIDADTKIKNDRTWSFWTKNIQQLTDFPVIQEWPRGIIKTENRVLEQSLHPYKYYSIEGLAYYEFIKEALAQCKQVTWLVSSITSEVLESKQIITTAGALSYTDYYFKGHFNAKEVVDPNKVKATNFMWQHFLGWKIKVDKAIFDPKAITYMDMRIPQPKNGLAFVYILPENGTQALVEYTLFSGVLLDKEEYEHTLSTYLSESLGLSSYQIELEEYNKIPMTTLLGNSASGSCIPIGTLAGAVKASTGYSFVRNQQHTDEIITALAKNARPPGYKVSKRHFLYDKVLLDVIGGGSASGESVFTNLYHKNKLPRLLKFLDEKTTLWEEIKIMNSVPKWIFIKSVLRNLF
ncbi:MAG: lycopene beta-cyclase [Marivirga sp.]|jgi:lycopene beta-cyclase